MSFVVFSLPRSRSAWLSAFLGAPGRVVGHDLGVTCASPAEFIWRLRNELAGTCETGAAFAAPLIKHMAPEVRFMTVRRPVSQVCASLARFEIVGVEQEMLDRDEQLDAIERTIPGVLRVDFADLIRPTVCAQAYQFCTGQVMDGAWWAAMDALNIQVDMARQMALLRANAPRIAGLKAQAAEMLANV